MHAKIEAVLKEIKHILATKNLFENLQVKRVSVVAYLEKKAAINLDPLVEKEYLFLLRNKKAKDINAGKYIGIGGKVEANESLFAALQRELQEEANLRVNAAKLCGYVLYLNLETIKNVNKELAQSRINETSEVNERKVAGPISKQISPIIDAELMAVYQVSDYIGALKLANSNSQELAFYRDGNWQVCDEGSLEWHTVSEFWQLPHWQGDECFLKSALAGEQFGLFFMLYRGDELLQKLVFADFKLEEKL